jgi:hypothetical protein
MSWISLSAAVMIAMGCISGIAQPLPNVGSLPTRKEMPDPMVLSDGTKVTTPVQWAARRTEIKRILEYYSIGTMPPPPGNVKGRDLKIQIAADGKAKFRLVHLSFGPDERLGFNIAILTPLEATEPFPTFVNLSFDPTPGMPYAPTHSNPMRPARSLDVDAAAARFAPQLDRGYAVVTYNYEETGEDSGAGLTNKFIAAYPDYDWHLEGAWAWGMSRVVDYLQTQSFADKSKLIAIGHSRLGKATLIAGAFDERFSMVAPVGSGAYGTCAFRFNGMTNGGKEGLDEIIAHFPHWIGPRLPQFSGRVFQLPFDQHWLIALVAPRPFISLEGVDDQYVNGNAVKQSYLAAKPVYDFLGATGNLGVNFRPGRHEFSPLDWQAAMDFADQELRGMEAKRDFQHFPPQDQLR